MYVNEMPTLLKQLANTPEMQRLSDIGMHCGTEYAKLPIYKLAKLPYSRLMHSIGVANIVWHFTKDIKQAIAGLLHDISTPVFAHTIDFMNNDHIAQESTEDKTRVFIENSKSIMLLLNENGICVDDVSDYHKYPIADNDTPMLSADRLEYTLGNGYMVYNLELNQIKEIYDDLLVMINEYGSEELGFNSIDKARKFVEISLRNSYLYVSNEDRFLMQYLAEIIRSALKDGTITLDDLYSIESVVIEKLKESETLSAVWNRYTNISAVTTSYEKQKDRFCVKISAKKRYINPLVLTGDNVKRISDIDGELKLRIDEFLNLDFNQWIYPV